jgi:hypothetical protein
MFSTLESPLWKWTKEFRKGTVVMKGSPNRCTRIEVTKELSKLILDENGKRFQGFGEEHN